MEINILGIDTSKNVYELCGLDKRGKKVLSKRVRRESFVEAVLLVNRCEIVMECSGGSHYWGRVFERYGYRVKLIAPQYVKPYVCGNKTDYADAQAICEASRRPGLHFVGVKTINQQEIQFLHRARSRCIKSRTALCNEIRGFLGEYGIGLPLGISHVRHNLHRSLESSKEMTGMGREMFLRLYDELIALDKEVKEYDNQLRELSRTHPVCQRLMEMSGIGYLSATALVSAVGNPRTFKNGRAFSASLGLVPRQSSSGENIRLGAMSRRGDVYLRELLIHGARAVAVYCRKNSDKKSIWVKNLIDKKGFNKAVVALANKQARIAWALMAKDKPYCVEMTAA